MPLPRAVDLRGDSEIALLLAIPRAPMPGRITGSLPSGQYTVEIADEDAPEVTAWPLNGFQYGVGDVVYVLLAANQADGGIILGSKAPAPTLGSGIVDHGGLTGLSDDDHTVYLLLAGRSGGQNVRGGTASGDNLALESTSHNTKGDVMIQPSGGTVGIRRSAAPEHTVHIGDAGNGLQPELALESNAGRKFLMAALDSDPFTVFGTASSHTFAIISNNTRRITFHPDGKVAWYGPGSAFAAQTNLHYHDGTTGFAIHSLTINSGTAQDVIPNAAGDVTTILYFEAITRPSTGTPAYASGPLTPSGATSTLYNNGSDNLLIRCTAGGAIQVQRTGGSLSYTVSLRLFWQ